MTLSDLNKETRVSPSRSICLGPKLRSWPLSVLSTLVSRVLKTAFNLFEVFQKGRVGRDASLRNQENQAAAKERRSSNDQRKPESFHLPSALVLVCSSEPTS